MTDQSPAQTTRLILDAVSRAGVRAVVSSGWAGLGEVDLPDTIHLVGDVPHPWLFPRISAVVHHGGAGTTAAGLRAGVPSIIVPFHGDQPFWGRIIHQRGLGPAPLPRRRLTAHHLAAALRAAAQPPMRAAAADMGARIRAENGLRDAVTAFNNVTR